jgi:anti-sigma factor RsiW
MRRDPKQDRGDAELLAAYVDGVAELSLEERKRVDDLLARDPQLRASEAATRELIGQLRELPPVGNEPDWNALERSIGEAVGDEIPISWWQRMRWRLIIPGVALATAAAILVAVMQDPASEAPAPTATPMTSPAVDDDEDTSADDIASTPLWLDGTDLEVALEAAELFDLEWDLDEESLPETAELLPPTDLEWVDDLDGESLDRAEKLLERTHPRRGRS